MPDAKRQEERRLDVQGTNGEPVGGNTFEHACTENAVKLERVQVHIADVAATGMVGAGTFVESPFEPRGINVPEGFLYEVAAPDGPTPID